MFLVYIIESLQDSSYYVGQTKNIESRLKRHNEGKSKYTKSKRLWKLVYTEPYNTRSEAIIREKEIKVQKKRRYIENLIKHGPVV